MYIMNRKFTYLLAFVFILGACANNKNDFDASGTFEAEEVIVSSELGGKILSFTIEEGQTLPPGKTVGVIDAENLSLQKEQVEESIKALSEKTADVNPQIRLLRDQLAVQQSQLNTLLKERVRIQNLLKNDAATGTTDTSSA